jgi:hypothetical protein
LPSDSKNNSEGNFALRTKKQGAGQNCPANTFFNQRATFFSAEIFGKKFFPEKKSETPVPVAAEFFRGGHLRFSVQAAAAPTGGAGHAVMRRNALRGLDLSGLAGGVYVLTLTDPAGRWIRHTQIVKE